MSPRGPGDDSDEGGFLRNWSRRKLAARRAETQKVVAEPEDFPAEEAADEEETQGDIRPEAELVDLSDLPQIDEITEATDIRPFMRAGVPAPLRSAALRRAWSLSRHAREYSDPAVDYAWDWNAPGGVPGGGGTLDSISVRKMVSDILNEKKPEVAEPVPTESTAAEVSFEPEASAEKGESPTGPVAEPVRRDTGAKEIERRAETHVRNEDSEPAPMPRRHGSARPHFDDET